MIGDGSQEEGWVVCRIFKKKNHLKTLDSPLASSISGEGGRRSHLFDACDEGALEQILQQMGRGSSCKEENNYDQANYNNYGRFVRPFDNNGGGGGGGGYHDNRFLKLPSLESPKSASMDTNDNNDNNNNGYHPVIPVEMAIENNEGSFTIHHPLEASPSSMVVTSGGLTNWAALDRLVASQLNGQPCFNDPTMVFCTGSDHHDLQLPTLRSSSSSSSTSSHAARAGPVPAAAYMTPAQDHHYTTTSEIDLWNFARSTSSEPLCHVSNTSV